MSRTREADVSVSTKYTMRITNSIGTSVFWLELTKSTLLFAKIWSNRPSWILFEPRRDIVNNFTHLIFDYYWHIESHVFKIISIPAVLYVIKTPTEINWEMEYLDEKTDALQTSNKEPLSAQLSCKTICNITSLLKYLHYRLYFVSHF